MIQEQYLDKVVEQLVGETIIDHDNEGIIFPFLHSHYNATFRNFNQLTANILMPLAKYTHSTYGLTEDEYQYVWRKYKSIILDKIKNKPLFALIDGKRLNESKQIDYLDKVVEYLVYDSKDDKLPFDNSYISFNTYIKNIYGITDEEVDYVYFKYRYLVGWDEVRRYNEYLPESLNESKEKKQAEYLNWALKTTIKHLRSELVYYNKNMNIDDYIDKIITGEYSNMAPASLLQMWRNWGLNWGEQVLLWEQIKDEWGYAKKLKRWYDKNRL